MSLQDQNQTVEERLAAARIEALKTGRRVYVVAWTDEEASWLSQEFNRNIFRFDHVEFGVELSDR